jgi:general secretion pathway protein G
MKRKCILMSQRGMSLVEILIVMTLIAVAGAFVVTQVFDRMQEGYQSAAKTQINSMKGMLEDYRRYCNQYPTTDQNLDALIAKPAVAPDCPNYPASAFIAGGKVPLDPWGRPYQYESDGRTYVIMSLGRDGQPEGEGFDRDIKSND